VKWLVAILEAILRALLPALIEASKPTAEDARPQPQLRERLRTKVRQAGWPAALLVLLMVTGCSPRTIYVPAGEPVRIRETVKDAKVWVLDKDGKPVAGRMDLPESWYALPPEEEE
jgi:hypothetical protein